MCLRVPSQGSMCLRVPSQGSMCLRVPSPGSIRSRAAPSVRQSVFLATPYIGHWGTRRCSQLRSAKGLALAGFGTPVELDPFSETNYVTFPSKG